MLFLIDQLDAPRVGVGVVIPVMLVVAATMEKDSGLSQGETFSLLSLLVWSLRALGSTFLVSLVEKNRFWVWIFDQFETDFWSGISGIRLGPLWFLIKNEWCLYQTCPTGRSHRDKHNLSQWDKQIGTGCAYPSGTGCTCPKPVPLGLGKVKRGLSLSHGQVITHAGGLSLSQDKLYDPDGTCPSTTCPQFSHKVGLQGRENFSDEITCITWKTEQNLEIWPFLNSRLEMWVSFFLF